MDTSNLASGDYNTAINSERVDEESKTDGATVNNEPEESKSCAITPESIEENELKLKERIAQCRNTIESLKTELGEEKSKLEKEARCQQPDTMSYAPELSTVYSYNPYNSDVSYGSSFSANIESRLTCDENLIEYEKQLLKYQNTLTMAQMEKKNAIRKQMLAKAYRLKLLEVENQCNIELLRVKQSLQCLEPLHAIANKWKIPSDDCDFNNFELMPLYSELNAFSGSDAASLKDTDARSTGKPESSKDGSSFNLNI